MNKLKSSLFVAIFPLFLALFSSCDLGGGDPSAWCRGLFPPGSSDCFGTQPGAGSNPTQATGDITTNLIYASEVNFAFYTDGRVEATERVTYTPATGSIAYTGVRPQQVPNLVGGCSFIRKANVDTYTKYRRGDPNWVATVTQVVDGHCTRVTDQVTILNRIGEFSNTVKLKSSQNPYLLFVVWNKAVFNMVTGTIDPNRPYLSAPKTYPLDFKIEVSHGGLTQQLQGASGRACITAEFRDYTVC